MQRILSTAARYLRSTLSQPGMIIVFTVLPIAFSLFFGSLFSQNGSTEWPVAIVTEDSSKLAWDIVDDLKSNEQLRVSVVTHEQAKELVSKREVFAAFILPRDISAKVSKQPIEVVVWREDQSNLYIALKQQVTRSVRRVTAASVVAAIVGEDAAYSAALEEFRAEKASVKVEPISHETASISNIAVVGLGMTIMFLMMSAVISTGVVLEERQKGTWRRLLAAPVLRLEVLLGYLLGFFVVALLQFGVLAVVQHYLFKVTWGNLMLLIPFASLFLICAISIGLAIAGMVRTFQQQSTVASLVMTASGMLSGIFWPVEIMPQIMQTIAQGMPQYWALQGFQSIMLRGQSASGLLAPALVLSGMTVVFLAFGILRVKYE